MNNDLVHFIAHQATTIYDHESHEGIFNAAGFSEVFMRIAHLKGVLDGIVVKTILYGRDDIEILLGGYYRLLRS